MLTKDSPEVQYLLNRIKEVVPGITGPVGHLWECRYNDYVGIEMVFDQEPPTAILREFRPGHYQLVALYLPHGHESGGTPSPAWEVGDYSYGQWFIPTTDADTALIGALHDTSRTRPPAVGGGPS